MTNIGNNFIIKKNIDKIDKVLSNDYLKEVNLDESIDELSYYKDTIIKHKYDFISYFYKDYLMKNQIKKEEKRYANKNAVIVYSDNNDSFILLLALCILIAIVGVIALIWYGFTLIPIFNKLTAIIPTGLLIGAICTLPSRVPSIIQALQRYSKITNAIKDKLRLLKERKENLAREIAENSKKSVSIDKVDSFIKLIVSYKDDLDGLSEEDSIRIKIELVKLGKEYMEYSAKHLKDGLAIDETMLKFNERLADIELEIERLKQNTTKNAANEFALEEAFGLDITKLDTSITELNPELDGPKLRKDLKIKDQFYK